MKKAKHIKNPKNTLKFLPILPFSRKTASLIIFILLFANIGTILITKSSAASIPSVNFVSFCPKGAHCNYTSINNLKGMAQYTQGWYLRETGKTFSIGSVYTVNGNKSGQAYGNFNTSTAYWNLLSELRAKGVVTPGKKTVIVTTSKVMGNCGVAQLNGDLAVVDPHARGGNSVCSKYISEVIAHELGHTFGLNHLSDSSLLHQPLACNYKYLSSCRMSSSQKSQVLTSYPNYFHRNSK